MLVFVDESGDTGFRFGAGSSEFFTVTLVLFQDRNAALACQNAIASLRRASKRTREYRFASCNHRTRIRFLEAVRGHAFEYASIVMNKRQLYGQGFRYKEPFIKIAMKYVFGNVADRLRSAKVVVDSNGDRDFRRTLQTYLKREIRPDGKNSPIQKVESKPSDRDDLIQLADMTCGAVARSFDGSAKNPECYRDILRRHEIGVQVWPKPE